MKEHRSWYDEGCSKLLDKKQVTLHSLQNSSEIKGAKLNNTRREASRHFRNNKRE
jgi:hypothetical protein